MDDEIRKKIRAARDFRLSQKQFDSIRAAVGATSVCTADELYSKLQGTLQRYLQNKAEDDITATMPSTKGTNAQLEKISKIASSLIDAIRSTPYFEDYLAHMAGQEAERIWRLENNIEFFEIWDRLSEALNTDNAPTRKEQQVRMSDDRLSVPQKLAVVYEQMNAGGNGLSGDEKPEKSNIDFWLTKEDVKGERTHSNDLVAVKFHNPSDEQRLELKMQGERDLQQALKSLENIISWAAPYEGEPSSDVEHWVYFVSDGMNRKTGKPDAKSELISHLLQIWRNDLQMDPYPGSGKKIAGSGLGPFVLACLQAVNINDDDKTVRDKITYIRRKMDEAETKHKKWVLYR